MKRLYPNLLAILIVVVDISADCVPYGAIISGTNSGSSCNSVWKRETRRVTFPDLYEQTIIVTGSGVCTRTQDFCCADYYYETKCWPLFYEPVEEDGLWRQDVYTGALSCPDHSVRILPAVN